MPDILVDRAPAKVNLTLAVRRRRADGYHDLESLVAFAGCADTLALAPGGAGFSLTIGGPTAEAAGPAGDNLVLTAARLLAERVPGLAGRFRLVKRLPVAAGLGGGSSDAAAALRLLARAAAIGPDDPRLMEAARRTGADVPVCLRPAARFMAGTGAELGPPLALPRLPALLVNPGVAVPTFEVFRALALPPGAERPADPARTVEAQALAGREGRGALVKALGLSRNDLEAPAIALQPAIGAALARVRASQGCLLARMSGSGATVFGLYESCRAAAAAAKAIRAEQPGWWLKPTMLDGQVGRAPASG